MLHLGILFDLLLQIHGLNNINSNVYLPLGLSKLLFSILYPEMFTIQYIRKAFPYELMLNVVSNAEVSTVFRSEKNKVMLICHFDDQLSLSHELRW